MAPKPKPKPKPKPPPSPTPTRQDHEPICEFTHPCTTSTTIPNPNNANANANTSGPGTASGPASGRSGGNPRKLISHIFGRNKTSTKLFPAHVWVHYCRKHYQRARYRARAWPFTQCELLLDSLDRMERWGGVESFEVVLRRREVVRLASSGPSSSKKKGGAAAGGRSTSTSASACPPGDEGEYADEEDYEEEEESSDDAKGKRQRKRKRRRPRIKTCPVPEWLRAETGPGKSFAEIRDLVKRIREDLTAQHRQIESQTAKGKGKGKTEQVLFPDIEILPTFRSWVLEQAGLDADGEGRKKMSRVSRKGGVQKVQR